MRIAQLMRPRDHRPPQAGLQRRKSRRLVVRYYSLCFARWLPSVLRREYKSPLQNDSEGRSQIPEEVSLRREGPHIQLLHKDPEQRLTLSEVKNHRWFLVDYAGDLANSTNIPSFPWFGSPPIT